MRPDGTLECFDEMWLANDGHRRDVKAGLFGTPLAFYDLVDQALIVYQSYFIRVEGRPWTICFPLARPDSIREGAKIRNLTKNTEYIVENVYTDERGQPTGVVQIDGKVPPDKGDRLRLSDDALVRFTMAFPRSNSEPFKFDADHNLREDPGAWFDTVTYLLIRRQPASGTGRPFERPSDIKKRVRTNMTIVDPLDSGNLVEVSTQRFDNMIQFDCWSKTMSGAKELMDWFTRFMEANTWVFKKNGVRELLIWEQKVDELATRWRNDIVNHTVQYFVRTELLDVDVIRRLHSAQIQITLLPTGTPTGVAQIPLPSGQIDLTVSESHLGTGV